MNSIFKGTTSGEEIDLHDKVTHAIHPSHQFSEESAIARVIVDAFVKEGSEPDSAFSYDGLRRFESKESFRGESREFELLSKSLLTVNKALDARLISEDYDVPEIKVKAFAASGLMKQMMSAQRMMDAQYYGDRIKLNPEQKILLGMAEKDPSLMKDITAIAQGSFEEMSPFMAGMMNEVMRKSAISSADKYHAQRLDRNLSLNADAMSEVLEQKKEIEQNGRVFFNEIDFPTGKNEHPDMTKLDLALKFATEKDRVTPEDRREFMKGENIAILKTVKVLVAAGYEEALKTGLGDNPTIPRSYGHSCRDVRTAAAVMANGAFGQIKSPSLLATMTMNLSDEMARSRAINFDNGKYIGAGNFSALDEQDMRELKSRVLDLSGHNIDFAYQTKRMVLQDGYEFDPVQTGRSLDGSVNQLKHKLVMQQHAQNNSMGM